MQFVTFRLADSMPAGKLREWREEREAWLLVHPKPWSPEDGKDYQKRFVWYLEGLLDEGAGECLLKDPVNRTFLEEALMCFHGGKVAHHAWVIMEVCMNPFLRCHTSGLGLA